MTCTGKMKWPNGKTRCAELCILHATRLVEAESGEARGLKRKTFSSTSRQGHHSVEAIKVPITMTSSLVESFRVRIVSLQGMIGKRG